MTDETQVEALAHVMHPVLFMHPDHAVGPATQMRREDARDMAHRILASPWLASHVAAAVQAERERAARGPGGFMSQAEWAEWSNDLARMIPEDYHDDVAQEAIIERYLSDVPQLVERAKALALREIEFQIRDANTLDITTKATICAFLRGKARGIEQAIARTPSPLRTTKEER